MPDDASSYHPQPLDTSQIELPVELTPLLEAIAENAHDVWAAERMKDHWTYGPTRNDAAKTNPTLVPYDQLPESEKHYDRAMATQTLKFVIAKGYRFVPPHTTAVDATTSDAIESTRRELLAVPRITLERVAELWRARDSASWSRAPELYALVASRFIGANDPLLAHDVLSQARTELEPLGTWKAQLRLRQLLGLALANCGAMLAAHEIALALREDVQNVGDQRDVLGDIVEDALSLVGRTTKGLALAQPEGEQRTARLRESFEAYLDAFDRSGGEAGGGFYSAINVATTAFLAGSREVAQRYARFAAEQARAVVDRGTATDSYWEHATFAEASLLLGDVGEAERAYRAAADTAGRNFGNLVSTRRQALLIAQAMALPADWVDTALPMPSVVVFSGHRIDDRARKSRRFPPALEERVRDALRQKLDELNAGFGFSGAANGADILFQEEMHRRHGVTHVILPYGRDDFRATNVVGPESGDWSRRYGDVLTNASEVVEATGQPNMERRVLFEYANSLLLGLASLHALRYATRIVPLVVWDGRYTGKQSGTAGAVAAWRRNGHDVDVIDLPSLLAAAGA